MNDKILCHKFILLFLLFTLNISSVVFGQYSWDKPVEVPENADAKEIEKIENFNREILLAKEAPDRNSKVEYLKKALTYRPNDPDNIRIEYKMAVMLSQYQDPENPQPMRREEALTIYEKIVNTYDHMQYYYSKYTKGSIENPYIMVPRAAVHAAGLTSILHNDELKARKYAEKAMDFLKMTYDKRRNEWLNQPAPPEVRLDGLFGGIFARDKWESRMRGWRKRQKDAAEGNVFGPKTLGIAESAVRQYGQSFGPQQGFTDVVSAMGNIMRDYPDTPMAKIASGFIERGKEKVANNVDREALEEAFSNYESPNTLTKPITSEEDLALAEIFIPTASIALKQGKPYILDLASREFVLGIPAESKVDSQRIDNHLTKVSKGDIAWDGDIITMRETKAVTIQQETSRPLQSTSAEWVKRYQLPDQIELPYSTMLITDKNSHYLITIHKIEPDGIRITYRKLNSDEAQHYNPTQKNRK